LDVDHKITYQTHTIHIAPGKFNYRLPTVTICRSTVQYQSTATCWTDSL